MALPPGHCSPGGWVLVFALRGISDGVFPFFVRLRWFARCCKLRVLNFECFFCSVLFFRRLAYLMVLNFKRFVSCHSSTMLLFLGLPRFTQKQVSKINQNSGFFFVFLEISNIFSLHHSAVSASFFSRQPFQLKG